MQSAQALSDRDFRSTPTPADAVQSRRHAVEQELLECLPLYRRMAARRLRSLTEADEVAQAFALRALERAGQLRELPAVRGWLRRIFETVLVDHCRRSTGRRSREVPFEVHLHDRQDESAAAPTAPDPAGVVVSLLPRLKPEYAEIIRKVDLMDRSRAEAAGELGITVNNLTVRLHRARAALRTQLRAEPSWAAAFA